MKVKLICQWCGKEYDVRPYKAKTSKYCSVECKNKAHSKRMTGKDNSNYGLKHALKVCPNCGKTFNPSKPEIIFCSKRCHSEYVRVVQTCLNCGKKYKIRKSEKAQNKKRFCSKKCKEDYQKAQYYETKRCVICGKEFTGLKSKNRLYCSAKCSNAAKGNGTELKCKECGKAFRVNPCKKDYAKFCSKVCCSAWCSKHRQGVNNSNYKGGKIAKICKICNKTFYVNAYRKESANYCSYECADVAKKAFTGKNNPHWSGGSIKYRGANWAVQRNKVLKRDSYTCQRCGNVLNDSEASVHHIISFRHFKSYLEANKLINLKTLCSKCHATEEQQIRSKVKRLKQKLNVENLPDLLDVIKSWFKEENGILVWR